MCDSVCKSGFVVYNLGMKKKLIIGGTSGIGSAIADVLNDEHEVIRIGRNEWNFVTEPCPFDLPSFDVLVFSAGAEFGGDQNFVTQTIDDTELTLQTNLNSQIRVFKEYVKNKQGPGHIIFVGSAHSCETTAKNKLIYTNEKVINVIKQKNNYLIKTTNNYFSADIVVDTSYLSLNYIGVFFLFPSYDICHSC